MAEQSFSAQISTGFVRIIFGSGGAVGWRPEIRLAQAIGVAVW
jgi:hypothetical protein